MERGKWQPKRRAWGSPSDRPDFRDNSNERKEPSSQEKLKLFWTMIYVIPPQAFKSAVFIAHYGNFGTDYKGLTQGT